MNYKIVSLGIASVLLASSIAYGFSRNLTGIWESPIGTVGVAHDVAAGVAKFTVADKTSTEFTGPVTGNDGSTTFRFVGGADDFSFETLNGTVCTLSGQLLATDGQVIGQFPNRKLKMSRCMQMAMIKCIKNNVVLKDDIISSDCSGTWK